MIIQDNYIRHIYKIEDIHDGDTLRAIIETGYNSLDRVTFRLKGINTAEINSKQPFRLALAKKAKGYLQDKVENHKVRVLSEKFEKGGFGRYLGTLFYENEQGEWINLNDELLDTGLAQSYYKGASKDEGEWKV